MTERRLPLALGNTGTSSDADANDIIQKSAGGIWVTRGASEIILPGRFLLRTVYTSGTSQTHNLQTLTTSFLVRGQGPGGGGGGVSASGGSQAGVGTGGSGGAYFEHRFTVVPGFSSLLYSVGAGGTASLGGDGTDGTADTTVAYHFVTVGGGYGHAGVAMVAANFASQVAVIPSASALPVGGLPIGSPQIGIKGESPQYGLILNNTSGYSGRGGNATLGRGGDPVGSFGGIAPGVAGVIGGGGSGGVLFNSGSGFISGGQGGNGILIIDEYS